MKAAISENIDSGEYLDWSKEWSKLLRSIIDSTKSDIKGTVDYRYVLMDFLSKDKELTEMILRWNSLDAQDKTWKTILMHLVISWCNPKLINYLLDRWVDKKITDSSWMTAYDLAVSYKRKDLLDMLK
jgi:hypothetical protein